MVVQKTVLVPIAVAVLGVASISAIIVLQRRDGDSRSDELSLSTVETDLEALQNAPFDANAGTGGSPTLAASLLLAGKAQIAATLASLRRDDPPVALRELQLPLLANYTTLDRIYRIGSTSTGYDSKVGTLVAVAAGSQTRVARLLGQADRAYRQRALHDDIEETAGAAATIVLLLGAFGFLYRQNERLLESTRKEALSDALTGLRNRRALVGDLAAGVAQAGATRPLLLGVLDLNGFKQYNDTFGHPAGDALLTRISGRLRAMLEGEATVYRMGGDEFCLLATPAPGASPEIVRRAALALSESGETFSITCSHGSALIPAEASSPEEALHLADQRMYARKRGDTSPGRQSSDVLLKVISERSSTLETHLGTVGQLARLVAQRLNLSEPEQRRIQHAAQLHDIGKAAIPDSLLDKPGPLSAKEWEYMRTHTLIGERILLAAPSLAQAAPLVRSSHERFDGSGYPDGLAGDQIPVGARIIAICDAFDAMTSTRPYSQPISVTDARSELQRSSGSQFDPVIVRAFDMLADTFKFGQHAGDRPEAAPEPRGETVGAAPVAPLP